MTDAPACQCAAAQQRMRPGASEALVGAERDAALAHAKEVARSLELWMRVFRCEVCGLHWAEACWTSGHMDVYYVFPVPELVDPERWLREDARALLPPR